MHDLLNAAHTFATGSAVPKSAAEIASGIQEAMARVAAVDAAWMREFNQLAVEQGFDLNRGDVMFVPLSYNMEAVPPPYRAEAVRRSPFVDDGRFIFMKAGSLPSRF